MTKKNKKTCGKPFFIFSSWRLIIACTLTFFFTGLLTACASSQNSHSMGETDPNAELEATWGVRVESIRLSAAGHLVDFRYRVIDPEKSATLMKRGGEAYIEDDATGTKLKVPVTKVGQLRGTGTKHQADRVYTVMFNTGGGLIKQGSKVTVVMGDFKAQHLTVE